MGFKTSVALEEVADNIATATEDVEEHSHID